MGLYRLYGVFLRHFTCKDPLKSSNFPCAPLHVTSLMVQSVYNCIIELLQMHYKPRFISPNMANLNAFFLWGLSSLIRRTLASGQCCRTKPKWWLFCFSIPTAIVCFFLGCCLDVQCSTFTRTEHVLATTLYRTKVGPVF